MKVPQIKEFAGISVRTGSLLIGWFSMIGAILTLVWVVYDVQDYMKYFENRYRERFTLSRFSEPYVMNDDDIRYMNGERFWRYMGDFGVALGTLVSMIFNGLFLIGVHKGRPNLMKFAIIPCAMVLIFGCLIIFNEAFEMGINRYVFREIVWLGGGYVLFIIMYSHFRELKIENSKNNIMSQSILAQEFVTSKDDPVKPLTNNMA